MQNILIIGAGEIGTALAHVIGSRAHIEMWDKDAQRASNGRPLEESVPEALVVFICVPSWVVRDLMARIVPILHPEAVLISLAKGIEEKTLKTMDAVLEECLTAGQKFGVLGGPLLAEELMADLPGVGALASKEQATFDVVAPLFHGSSIRLEYTDDPHGVAVAAVLKNVYAVGLGVADGLGWGWNGKGWLAAQALREMKGIMETLGADRRVVDGSAGAGDFLATAMSPDSRNRETGREIAVSGSCKIPSEGCHSVPSVLALAKGQLDRLPFLCALDRIITKHENANDVFQDLFAAH